MKKTVLSLLKLGIPLAIIVWLLMNLEEESMRQLRERPKDWGLLTAALVISLIAVCITFVRWFLLVRALNMRFRMRDAFRLGFLGFLLNFVSPGSVGGDLFKAYFIAREQHGRRAEAVATVVVDRMIGLYALFLVTSLAIWMTDVSQASQAVQTICNLTYLATAVGAVAVLMVMIPGFTNGAISEWLSELPKIGPTIERLIEAVRMYRNRRGVLAVIVIMSMAVHCLLAVSIFLSAKALYENVPSLNEHMIIAPLSFVFGALPITPNGLGTMELALNELYKHVPAESVDASGTIIALTFRVMTIIIAMIGVAFYWTSRREVRELLQQAEHDQETVPTEEADLNEPKSVPEKTVS